MKFAVAAIFALAAVAQGFILPAYEGVELKGNVIDNLITEALEYIRTILKNKQPYTLSNIPELTVVDTDINLKVNVSDLTVDKADDFVIEHIENNLPNLWAKFQLKAPKPHIETGFTISGNAFSKDVSGTGSISIDLADMDVSGFVQMELIDHALHMKTLTLNYTLDSAQFAVSGLNVEGMTEEEITDFLNKNLLPTLQAHQTEVCARIAKQIQGEANIILAGKTLTEVIEWLKNFIGH